MPIDKKSRYSKSELVKWTRRDGTVVNLISPTLRPARDAVFQRQVTDTDRLDSLAAEYYRDPNLRWLIADAAPVMDPFDATVPGVTLKIPPRK